MRKSYQGAHSLEGNQSSKFLQKVDMMEMEIMKLPEEKIISSLPFVKVIREFRCVQESCFGVELKEGYSEAIDSFSQAYRALDITVTPKVFELL